MKSRFLRTSGIRAGLCWLAAVLVGNQVAIAVSNLKVGNPLPAFSLPRADGAAGEYSAEQLKGQPAAVVFWRPGQKLSLEALRDLETITQELGSSKVRIVAVDTSRSETKKIQAVLASEQLSYPILLDRQRVLYGKVGVIVSPTTLLLDAKGVLRFVAASHPRQFAQVVRARLRFLLGEINEEQMNQEIEPHVLKIEHEVAAGWRMYNLGRRLQAEGKSEQARTIFEKAVSQYPSLPEARCALGFMKLEAGEFDAARQHFQTALAYQPASTVARLGQAAVLARNGQHAKAEPILLSLLGSKAIAVRVRYELGLIYHERGEIDKAVTYYQDALTTLFPESGLSSTKKPPAQAAVATHAPAGPTPVLAAGTTSATPGVPAAKQAGRTVEAVVPPADAKYIGIKRCKKCHLQQWKTWEKTKMAAATDLLKPGVRAEAKANRKLEPRKDYTTDAKCLRCHTNGFGHTGGYPDPAAGDARAAKANAGIGCESCHGPGNSYEKIHKDIQDKRRNYTQAELYDAGQYKVDARVCAACHNNEAPCVAPGTSFDFVTRKEQGTHKHHELRFRTK